MATLRNLTKGDKVALIVNECQRGLLEPDRAMFPDLANEFQRLGVLPKIEALLAFFRENNLPVLHTPIAHRPDHADMAPNSLIAALSLKQKSLTIGSYNAEVVPSLRPLENEFVIHRTAGILAMNQTSLDITLRRLGVTRIVIVGVSSTLAVPGITMAAVDNGYHVFVPDDCICGADPAVHKVIMDHQVRLLATVTTSEVIMDALR